METNLHKSAVNFDAETHSYEYKGKSLLGVTLIVGWVFNDTYDGIPADVLKRAAEHGSAVHKACELYDSAGVMMPDYENEVSAYQRMKNDAGVGTLCNEYLVDMTSREYGIASSIDVVFREKDGRYPLADIKTTSAIHIQNVTLQLSIYAMMFEICNPDKTAGELFVAWLPKAMYGTPRMIQVQRIPVDECEVIINEYLAKGDAEKCRDIVAKYVQQPTFTEGVLPVEMADVEKEIVRIEQEQKKMKERSDELRAGLLKLMQKHNVKKWEGEHIILTRKEGGVRVTLDSAKVKSLHPDIYAECCKESKTSESLMLKIK